MPMLVFLRLNGLRFVAEEAEVVAVIHGLAGDEVGKAAHPG